MAFHLLSEDYRRLRDRATWFGQVCFRAGAADHGSRKFASGKVQRHLRGCCHLRRSAVDRPRHSGHDILSVDSMEGGKKSQRYHGRAQEVRRSGQSRSSVGWLAPRHRVFPGGAANVYCRFLIRSHPRRSGRGYTLRAHEEGVRRTFIDTTNRGRSIGVPLVDVDWHAFCQAIYQGIEGQQWGSDVLPP